jgi:hypothetical protein
MSEKLPIWVVYDNPSDFPGKFVARKWFILPDALEATQEYRIADTLEDVRAFLPRGLTRLTRHPDDEPQIVESWI